jgi:hypothetical protein
MKVIVILKHDYSVIKKQSGRLIIQVKQRTIIHGGMDRSWNTLTINFYQICVFRNMYSVVMIMEEILNYRTFSL